MPGGDRGPQFMTLVETVRFVIHVLVRWAQTKQYGEIRIVVQGGQIEFVHESKSHRGSLPRHQADGQAEAVVKMLTAT